MLMGSLGMRLGQCVASGLGMRLGQCANEEPGNEARIVWGECEQVWYA